MGGAERTARKQRQEKAAKRAVAQARGGDANKKMIVAVIGIVVLAAIVIGGVLWTNASKNNTAGQDVTPQTDRVVGGQVVEKREGAVVLVGKPGVKKVVDIYADFLCPACGQFQELYGKQIEDKVNNGELAVRYHMVPFLNKSSDPPGYSLESANASLVAADFGKFTPFHDSLFKDQPEEGKRGYDKGQLIKLGQGLGITDPKFAAGVNGGIYEKQIVDDFSKTVNDPNFHGTPTVVYNGARVEYGSPDWLDKMLGGAKG